MSKNSPILKIDPLTKCVFVQDKEISHRLSVPQRALLELIYQNNGNVVSRKSVVAAVWHGENPDGISKEAIDALFRRLRYRIAEIDPNNKYLEAVRGKGFRLNIVGE